MGNPHIYYLNSCIYHLHLQFILHDICNLLTAPPQSLLPVSYTHLKAVVDYFGNHPQAVLSLTTIVGFKAPEYILFHEDLKRWESQMNLTVTVDSAKEPGYQVGLVTKYIPDLKFRKLQNAAAIVVGPPVMMKFAVAELEKLGIKDEQIWISQERKMCCGLGKCGHCRMGDAYICLDGPVFNYTEGKKLMD